MDPSTSSHADIDSVLQDFLQPGSARVLLLFNNNCVRTYLDAEVLSTILTQIFCIAAAMSNCLVFLSNSNQKSNHHSDICVLSESHLL